METVILKQSSPFWGEVRLEPGQVALGRIGGRALKLRRLVGEWQVARLSSPNVGDSGWTVADASGTDHTWDPEQEDHVLRTVFERSPDSLLVSPFLPDRSLVVRPVVEIGVPPREQVTIYVSAPLWVSLDTKAGVTIYREALDRPRDTWFGDTTRVGELCYAGRTEARLSLENVTVPLDRALTKVTVRNDSSRLLSFSRLRLPLTHLSLFRDEAGVLWTEPASLISSESELSRLEIDDDAAWLKGKVKVAGPRHQESPPFFLRALGSFFRPSEAFHGE